LVEILHSAQTYPLGSTGAHAVAHRPEPKGVPVPKATGDE
jgi:hypothetical protein